MKKNTKILLAAICFSLFFMMSTVSNVKAEAYPFLLNYLSVPHIVYSAQSNEDPDSIIITIVNRDTAMIYYAGLNSSAYPCRDGFIFVFPLSNLKLIDFILAILQGQFPSLNSIYFNSMLFPGFEMYNDTNLNGVLDVTRSNSTNSTEARYYIVPLAYTSYSFADLNLQEFFHIQAENKPSHYNWSVQYNDVIVGIYNATLVNSTGEMDGFHYGNDSFSHVRFDYDLTSNNNLWNLKRSINLSAYDDSGEEHFFVNLSLAAINIHIYGAIAAQTLPISGVNSSNVEFSTTTSTPIDVVSFILSSGQNVGQCDNNATYPLYNCSTNQYNATSVVSPEITVSADFYLENFTNSQTMNVELSGNFLVSRICYNTWNGSSLYHDPLFLLPLLNPEIPLWWAFVPDYLAAAGAIQQQNAWLWLILIIVSVVLIFIIVDTQSGKIKSIGKRRHRATIQKPPTPQTVQTRKRRSTRKNHKPRKRKKQ